VILPKQDTEEYLEAILDLKGDTGHVKTTELSKRLEVSPASVTEKLQRLSKAGLVVYKRYKGVMLTERGRAEALRLKRKHRLLEVFLQDVLHIKPSRVHEDACKMEHALSDEAERAMCRMLGAPDACPHGSAIPPCDGEAASCVECMDAEKARDKPGADKGRKKGDGVTSKGRMAESVPLTSLEPHREGRVAFIRGGRGVLMKLCKMGLTPGVVVYMVRSAPMHGPVQVRVRGCDLAIGHGIAGKIFVIPKKHG